MLGLVERGPGVVGQRDLMHPLGRHRPGVGLVVAGPVTGVAQQQVELLLGQPHLLAVVLDLLHEDTTHLGDLAGAPRALVVLDPETLGKLAHRGLRTGGGLRRRSLNRLGLRHGCLLRCGSRRGCPGRGRRGGARLGRPGGGSCAGRGGRTALAARSCRRGLFGRRGLLRGRGRLFGRGGLLCGRGLLRRRGAGIAGRGR